MNKQEEREYWTKLLAENDGAVWCDIGGGRRRWVIAYIGGDTPFICVAIRTCGENEEKNEILARYKRNDYNVFFTEHATPILPKPSRPWTAEEIMLHQGCFEVDGFLTRVLCAHNGKLQFCIGPIAGTDIFWHTVERFVSDAMAVMPDGTRVELYKEAE